MDIKDISLPEVYTNSEDFRFFCKWFATALEQVKYDTDNMVDLYDPLRCPADLIWALADTMGYTYDDRLNLPISFNRLVLLNFMEMIYKRGSQDGVTLSAEVNLAQFNIMNQAKENDILYDRLDDTSIPANAVSVIPHTEYGYIDVVYFSTRVPTDACIEYTRPLGMFLFQQAGVKMNARSKISIDARLTDSRDMGYSPTPDDSPDRKSWITQVAQYSRDDYARLQRGTSDTVSLDQRNAAWYRNSKYEQHIADTDPDSGLNENGTNPNISPGVRSLYSLQLSNNDNIVRSLLDPLFSIGFDPQNIDCPEFPDDYILHPSDEDKNKPYNLRYDEYGDTKLAEQDLDYIQTLDETGGGVIPSTDVSIVCPYPAVNPIMSQMGDAISISDDNSSYMPPVTNETEEIEEGD